MEKLTTLSALFISLLASPLHGQASSAQQTDAKMFCWQAATDLEKRFAFGKDHNNDPMVVHILSDAVQKIRSQQPEEFLLLPGAPKKYWPLSRIIQAGLNLPNDPMLLYDANELRFIPHTQQGQDVALVAAQADNLTPSRTKAVIATAKRMNIRISVVWHHTGDVDQSIIDQVQTLAQLSQQTGGAFLNLGGPTPPCHIW